MTMKESFEEGQNKWACIRISRPVHFPNSEIEKTDFLTGRILQVFDDHLDFALYDSLAEEKAGQEPVEAFKLSFAHIITWTFEDW